MANIKEIRDRIRSINDTKKITNAMYLISSNKVRKARKMLEETEPFFFRVQEMMDKVMLHLPPGTEDRYLNLGQLPPLKERKRSFLVITDDKGLAGAYNHNILKTAEEEFALSDVEPRIFAIGEVGRQYFLRQGREIAGEFRYTVQSPTISRARDITSVLLRDYLLQETDELLVIYTMTKNGILSEVQKKTLLPLEVPELVLKFIHSDPEGFFPEDEKVQEEIARSRGNDEYLMLPDPKEVLDHIVPSFINGFVYGSLVEAYCAVQNDRMVAMDAANKNAQKMIRELGIRYNRERQSMITQEITEVVSGARGRAGKR